MIELPEAVVISKQFSNTLVGKRITRAAANTSPHKFAWYSGDPAKYQHILPGKTIRGAQAFGNHVEIQADDYVMVISTPIRYHAPGEAQPAKHQLHLEFEDGSAITCTVQMWGAMMCFPQGEKSGLPDYQLARQKPSPLSEAFDRAYFSSLWNAETPQLSAKSFLATEQRIPGLGNGVLQDILWTARIHPKRKMKALAEPEIEAMFTSLKCILEEMTARGGRDTERDFFWQSGGYKTILSKNTLGTPCPVCGTIIRKEPYLGGVIYLCDHCQK